MKRVIVVCPNIGSPLLGPNLRTYYCAKAFEGIGVNTVCLTSSYSHKYSQRELSLAKRSSRHCGLRYRWLGVPRYRGVAGRTVSNLVFSAKVFIYLAGVLVKTRSDSRVIVIASTPTLEHLVSVLFLRLASRKVCFVWDVRDIWPLALSSAHAYLKTNPYYWLLYAVEIAALKICDTITSPLREMSHYLVKRGVDPKKFVYIPNCIGLDNYSSKESSSYKEWLSRSASGFSDLALKSEKIKIVYAGALDRDNIIEPILERVAYAFSTHYSLHIIGKGVAKDRLLKKYGNFSNIFFYGMLKSENVYHALKYADVAYMGLSDKPEFKYGIALNKMYEYMRASLPIIFYTSILENTVAFAQCGFVCDLRRDDSLDMALNTFSQLSPDEKAVLGRNGYSYLSKVHSYEVVKQQWSSLTEL